MSLVNFLGERRTAPLGDSNPRDRIVVASATEIQLGQQLGWRIDEVLGPVVRCDLVCFGFWYHVPGISGLVLQFAFNAVFGVPFKLLRFLLAVSPPIRAVVFALLNALG